MFLNPIRQFLLNPHIKEKTKNFMYIRGTFELTLVTAAPGMCYGEYAVCALPIGGTKHINSDFTHCLGIDHFVTLDIAHSETVTLRLPWLYQFDVAQIGDLTNDGELLWSVAVYCLSPSRSALDAGESTTGVKMYGRFLPDVKLVVPQYQASKRSAQQEKITPSISTSKGKYFSDETNAMISSAKKGIDTAAMLADAATMVPDIAPFAATASLIAHSASAILGMFGYTRKTKERNPLPISMRSVTNVAHMEGDDSGDTASLALVNEITCDPRTINPDATDDLSFPSLFGRWGHVKTMTWSQSQGSGADVGDVWVSPFYAKSVDNVFSFTTTGYVGLPFEYWRGDMEYMIVIPTSKVHRGSLQFFWSPLAAQDDSSITNTTLNWIHDISADETVYIRIGFSREVPYCLSVPFSDAAQIVPFNSTNGQLRIKVVNPLCSPGNAPLTVLVFARAGKNMDFAKPRDFIFAAGNQPYQTSMPSLQLQGALGDGDSTAGEPKFIELVPSSGNFPGNSLFFGERVASARAMMQKPCRLYYDGAPSGRFSSNSRITSVGSSLDTWTYQKHYSAMLVGLATSERYKLIDSSNSNRVAGAFCQDVYASLENVGTLAPLTSTGANKGAEFNIPWYHPSKYSSYYGMNVSNVPEICFFVGSGQGVSYVQETGTWYSCFGPDIRSAGFYMPPRVKFATKLALPFVE